MGRTALICEPVLKCCTFLVVRNRAHLLFAHELTELVCMAEKCPDVSEEDAVEARKILYEQR